MSTHHKQTLLCYGIVALLSYFTYVHNYASPPAFYWDENYHVASAEKYLSGTFFMEPHPPLGKLLIAAGEAIVDANADDDQFLGTDYAQVLPPGFSFAGYRLLPALLGMGGALVLFAIFMVLTGNQLWSLLLTFPYLFDNALIVHSRGAMLDPPMVFFTLTTILAFVLLLKHRAHGCAFAWFSLLFGTSFGLLMTTKVLGLVAVLLVPAVVWEIGRSESPTARGPLLRGALERTFNRQNRTFLILAIIGFIIPYITIWHMHFRIAENINPILADNGYYKASDEYKQILREGRNGSLAAFPTMLRDTLRFLPHYSRGVPRLNMCKSDENGSPAFLWPFGARTISYRWESAGSGLYRYLYVVPNPVGWIIGLAGVILAASLLIAHWTLPLTQKLKRPELLLTFLALYGGFMVAVSRLDRVMYLYHYFLPLVFSFILFGIVIMEIKKLGNFTLTDHIRTRALLTIGVLVFLGFQFMRPLTYYEPISNEALQHRNLLKLWEMTCATCDRESALVEVVTCES